MVLRIRGWNGLGFVPAGMRHTPGFEGLVFFGGHVPDLVHPVHPTGLPAGSEPTAGKKAEDRSHDEEEKEHLHQEEGHEPGQGSKKKAAGDGFENLRFHFSVFEIGFRTEDAEGEIFTLRNLKKTGDSFQEEVLY